MIRMIMRGYHPVYTPDMQCAERRCKHPLTKVVTGIVQIPAGVHHGLDTRRVASHREARAHAARAGDPRGLVGRDAGDGA